MSRATATLEKSAVLLPTTYLAVLSLIGGGAKYGYEINKILEDHGYRNWVDIKFSSVYKALGELEKKGLIKGKKSEKSLQPSKKTFSLTPRGERTLRDQIKQCLSDPPTPKSLFDLGMSAISLLTRDEALYALHEYADKLDRGIEFLRSNVEALKNFERVKELDPSRVIGTQPAGEMAPDTMIAVVQALFERPLVRVRCEREWLQTLIKRIEHNESDIPFRRMKSRK
ncbi:MAG: PadR family transcriptional regulator [Candidatus Thorarchaeota archaeon]|jgi:DNA-binding PadR family transcriptional regulator